MLCVVAAVGVTMGTGDVCRADDETAIRKTVEAYVAAFNKGDAAALAACWAEDAEFRTPGGETFKGRKAIREGFESFFKGNPGAKLTVEIAAIRVDQEAADEEGTAKVSYPDGETTATTYAARYAKQDGKWLLAGVREAEAPPSHYEQLKELEWMVGHWVDKDEEATIETVCQWTKNRNFLSRSFSVSTAEGVELEGTQVIGWDPAEKVIRSWLFDSDGGFGVGVWSRDGDRWTIRALQVLPDGRKASAVNVLSRVDQDTFTWQSTAREVDGEVLPSIGPVSVARKPSSD
jgi:uncharacterized protein (TIGR02246 family)